MPTRQSTQQFDSQSDIFKAMAHPTRLRILHYLRNGERCVCEIYPALDLEQSNISRHLAILRKEGILAMRKEGLNVYYRVNDPKIFNIMDLCSDIFDYYWRNRFSNET